MTAVFAERMFPKHRTELRTFARQIGGIAGRWHDLGKFTQAFQTYLHRATDPDCHASDLGRVDHSTAGAQYAVEILGPLGLILAYVVAGHHAGLADWDSQSSASALKSRLRKTIDQEWRSCVPGEVLDIIEFTTKSIPLPQDGFAAALFIRMLFSCLTDADFLATERFMSPDKAAQRPSEGPGMARLSKLLDEWLAARFPEAETPVHRHRHDVLSACRARAEDETGFFSLTVPTGGGKTFSSLAFALRHAAYHGLRRVIYVIPFTSIIEQTADQFREALASLGPEIVLEHHANLDVDDPKTQHTRLFAENWDAPLIVTTNVQFFESLFAHRPGRCRKLHRIAGSVIILDESQSLPVTLLRPALGVLKELTARYGCSVVSCTATQPALGWRSDFPIGLEDMRELVSDPETLFTALKRVHVHYCTQPVMDHDLAGQLAGIKQGMIIVNTRRHARELFDVLDKVSDHCLHLSARMCPQHRTTVLNEIRERLKTGQECRVVSTQLVEAGVDLDFPVVWRAMASLSSLVQAAGRCNREGRARTGNLFIFVPYEEKHIPAGEQRRTADLTREIIELPQYGNDPLGLKAIDHYFRLHYWNAQGNHGWDREEIMQQFKLGNRPESLFPFQFKTAAERFRLIDEGQRPIIIPWDDRSRTEVETLRKIHEPTREFIAKASRALQRYIVTVPEWEFDQMIQHMMIDPEPLHGRFFILTHPGHDYDAFTGLKNNVKGPIDPARLIG
ncbi:MAG: CRISPR-associated endonuclease Cas3'' [Nitrospirae bacterium]|nr:CRISPR-associated endonuclease Cas3'' [Magnetococcales bacterium]